MADNTKEYTSLLSPGKQWGELAGQFIGGYKSEKKKAKELFDNDVKLYFVNSGNDLKVRIDFLFSNGFRPMYSLLKFSFRYCVKPSSLSNCATPIAACISVTFRL